MVGGAMPDARTLALAALYSVGAHGIMTLNDFKSVEGDRRMGIGSLPVQLGAERAARVACVVMACRRSWWSVLLLAWGSPLHAAAVGCAARRAGALMRRFLAAPREQALWYSGFGVPLYVLGMLVTAFAFRGLVA